MNYKKTRVWNYFISIPKNMLFMSTFLLASCVPYLNRDYKNEVNPFSCNAGNNLIYPIEFDESGRLVHEKQINNITQELNRRKINDVFIFVHGWNNTTSLAKETYEKLICQLPSFGNNLRKVGYSQVAVSQNSIFIPVFWPSTINPVSADPIFMQPKTYFDILDRADILAIYGFQRILLDIQNKYMRGGSEGHLRLHLVGHSFGGRIVVSALYGFMTNLKNHPTLLLDKLDKLNLILLLPAIPNNALDSHKLQEDVLAQVEKLSAEELIGEEQAKEYDRRFKELLAPDYNPPSMGGAAAAILGPIIALGVGVKEQELLTKSREEVKLRASKSLRELGSEYQKLKVFTVYSKNDVALGFGFPLASIFNKDLIGCALGGCGTSQDENIVVDTQGNLVRDENLLDSRMLSIDATSLIFGHTDIYKHQVSELIWTLLFNEKAGP